MAATKRQTSKQRKPAGPKPQVVRPVQVRTIFRNQLRVPFQAERVDCCDGLLVITKYAKFDGWAITHVNTGCAFPVGEFRSKSKAIKVAQRIFEKYPLKQLRAYSEQKVVGDWTRKRLMELIGKI